MLQYLKNLKRNRYVLAALICVILQGFLLQVSIAKEKETVYPELPLKQMRIAAYTKAFAERFGLPTPAPGTEPSGGLEAIEFAIEKAAPWAPLYYCNYYLYLDSSLKLEYPEEGVAGNKEILISASHFFGRSHEQWMKWSLQDRRHSTNLDGGYNRKAYLASMNYIPNKRGAIDDLSYLEYHRELLPELTYIKLGNPPPLIIGKPCTNFDIWLKKMSKSDYRGQINIDPDDFIKFEIPSHIFRKVREWGLEARESNEIILKKLRGQRIN